MLGPSSNRNRRNHPHCKPSQDRAADPIEQNTGRHGNKQDWQVSWRRHSSKVVDTRPNNDHHDRCHRSCQNESVLHAFANTGTNGSTTRGAISRRMWTRLHRLRFRCRIRIDRHDMPQTPPHDSLTISAEQVFNCGSLLAILTTPPLALPYAVPLRFASNSSQRWYRSSAACIAVCRSFVFNASCL